MKFKDVEHLIDQYFEKVTPEEVITMFEKMGYQFTGISEFKSCPINKNENNLTRQ